MLKILKMKFIFNYIHLYYYKKNKKYDIYILISLQKNKRKLLKIV